jgi:hypothetical protein
MESTTSHHHEQTHKQTQLLLNSPATLKQKLKMVDIVIRPGIAYSFYAIPYSMPNIAKLDQKIIALQKAICGLPKSIPNITTKLPHDQFGLNAQSLKTEYLTYIGKQLCNALNDLGRLGIIYTGLTKHILAKKTTNHPHITINLSRKYLHQLLLLNITTLEQITLPNRMNIMNEEEFHQYHKKPTPTIKKILKIASHLFCTSTCADACRPPCNTHQQSYTLLPEIANRPNQNFYHNPLPENNPIAAIQEPPKPPKRMQKLQDYSITTIINTKQSKRKDKFNTIKLFTSYKCTWIQPENQSYTMWMSTDKIFPRNKPNIVNHNLPLLKQFYLTQQHKHYSNIIEFFFHQSQSKDTRYVHEPLNLPLIQIHIHESNPDKDIKTTQPTIQLIGEEAHIFTDIGNLLITIPKTRLEWLWKQYNSNSST